MSEANENKDNLVTNVTENNSQLNESNHSDQTQNATTNENDTSQNYCYYMQPQLMGYTSPQSNSGINSPYWSGEPVHPYMHPYVNHQYKAYGQQVFNYSNYSPYVPSDFAPNWQNASNSTQLNYQQNSNNSNNQTNNFENNYRHQNHQKPFKNYQNKDKSKSNEKNNDNANKNISYNIMPNEPIYGTVYPALTTTNTRNENESNFYSKQTRKATHANTEAQTNAKNLNINNISTTNSSSKYNYKSKKSSQSDVKRWSEIVSPKISDTQQPNDDRNNALLENPEQLDLYAPNDENSAQNGHKQFETSAYDHASKYSRNYYKNQRYNNYQYEGYEQYYIPQYADANYFNMLTSQMANFSLITNRYKNYNNNNNSYSSYNYNHYNNYIYRSPLLDKYNPKDFYYNGEKEGGKESRFFVIKSYSKDDVVHSIKHGLWCSTENGNIKLNQAFNECAVKKNASVYLLFSVNSSGQFCGLVEMLSKVDFEAKANLWTQDKWKGKFEVKWVFVKDVPNTKLRHIILTNNENKSVTNSRDTQEILFEQAIEVLNVFRNYNHKSTILDDVDELAFSERVDSNLVKVHSYKQQKLQITNANTTIDKSKPEIQIKKILSKNEQLKQNSEKGLEKTDDQTDKAQSSINSVPGTLGTLGTQE